MGKASMGASAAAGHTVFAFQRVTLSPPPHDYLLTVQVWKVALSEEGRQANYLGSRGLWELPGNACCSAPGGLGCRGTVAPFADRRALSIP